MARRALYAGTIFLSAVLLFLVQPMMGRLMLARFGGSAAVWTAAMLFFQTALLAGYGYAHLSIRYLRPRAQIGVHVLLLAASAAFLPARAPDAHAGAGDPAVAIFAGLAASVGVPFVLLAATSPLLQAWYALRLKGSFPYRLYAVSNAGSLVALLAYPVVVEPTLGVHAQLSLWSWGYGVFALFCTGAAVASGARHEAHEPGAIRWRTRALWIGLAACASAMWMGAATHLSQSVAPVPLLWVAPLAIYLLTFILAFDRDRWYSPAAFRYVFPLGAASVGFGFAQHEIRTAMLLLAVGLFACCLFCHGEIARRRPEAGNLTSFYFTIACGGALGGVFTSLIAPRIFAGYLELPVTLVCLILLAARLLFGFPLRRVVRLAAVGALAFAVSLRVSARAAGNRVRARNFYGAVQVSQVEGVRLLNNGATRHGSQFQDAVRRRMATSYYGPGSGVARAINAMRRPGFRGAFIGLGTGTLAVFGQPGDQYRFYELNPLVVDIARSEFTYLSDSAAHCEVVTGDGRLAMEREPWNNFDLIVLDAFTGDSIPVHLLTREAFALWFRHLRADGAIAVHITNRYLDLWPVVARAAREFGKEALLVHSGGNAEQRTFDTRWVIVTGNREIAARIAPFDRAAQPVRLWTDDYVDLLGVMRDSPETH